MRMRHYKMLDSYILRKYLKTFLLAIALIIIIVITFDVSEKLDDFLSNRAPLKGIIFQYYLTFIPNFINLYSPLFIFIAVIFFTSKMAGNTEIIAILSSGISYRRLLRPYLYGSLLVAILILILGNFVIPITYRTQLEFDKQYIHVSKLNKNYYSNIHFQSAPGVQVYTESYDVKRQAAHSFFMEHFDNEKRMVKRISAESLRYDTASHQWTALQYFERTWENGQERLVHYPEYTTTLEVKPDDFFRARKIIFTMTTPELHRYIQSEIQRGSSAVTEAKIEYYSRLLNPLAILIMTFIGVAVSSRKTRGGMGMHLTIGVAVAFSFIVIMKITSVFSINGNMSPFMAVLFPQILFGIAAAYLVKTAPK